MEPLPPRLAANRRVTALKTYFFSDSRRCIQTVLGLIWVLVGALQFQSFMYGKGFIQCCKG